MYTLLNNIVFDIFNMLLYVWTSWTHMASLVFLEKLGVTITPRNSNIEMFVSVIQR
jgi:hypothetical protein